MIKKTLFLFLAILLSSGGYTQTVDFNPQIGISLKASSNGFGGDIYYRPMEKLAIKAGAEYLNLNVGNNTLERYVGDAINITINNPIGSDLRFNSEGKFKTGALALGVGYQPFKIFYVTAGIGKYLFDSKVTGIPTSDLTFTSQEIQGIGTINPKISKEALGVFNITVNPSNTIIPYLGIGLGSFVPQNKSFSFALEVGAYYVGSYVLKETMPPGLILENVDYGSSISQQDKDIISGVINSEANTAIADLKTEVSKTINEINKTIEPYKFYPVLKLTIGFRAFEFTK